MKWIRNLLYVFLLILSLISIFIIACSFNPQLADKTAAFLYDHTNAGRLKETTALNASDTKKDGRKTEDREEGAGTSDELLRSISAIGASDKEETAGNSYVAPERSGIETPKEVAGKSGYVPVEDKSESVDDTEAERIKERITYGETGDALAFDTDFYPYYGMLDDGGQKLYRQIYANAMAVNGIFSPVVTADAGMLKNAFMAVVNDHPELFWLDTAYKGRFGRDGVCVEISLQFNETTDRLDMAKSELEAATSVILDQAGQLENEYEKEVYVHDVLLGRIAYRLSAPLNQTAYSALVNGQTVCAGYARAFQYLMQQLGIPCYYCTGYAGQNHAWNIIRLGGEFYNVDVTWDDTEPNTYRYFNQTDGDFSGNHRREELSVNLPACNGTVYRNLERNPEEENRDGAYRSSPEEIGITPEEVLTSLEDYYDNCYEIIMQSGGSTEFQNVVADERLWLQCYDAYDSDAYAGAYMNRALTGLNASSCSVDIQAQELKDGSFLLHHIITFLY